jgi:hypothetical protein
VIPVEPRFFCLLGVSYNFNKSGICQAYAPKNMTE